MDLVTTEADPVPRTEGERMFDLFRRPQGRSRPRPDERAAIESARTGELSVGGGKVVTYTWGTGERPVLLVHGWESRASRYAKLVTRLLELGLSPVSFDAPGHGESEGDSATLVDYRTAIRALHRAHGDFEAVVGHSFGALALFLSLPQGLVARRMVAISTVPDFAYLVDSFCAHTALDARTSQELRDRLDRDLYPGEDMWTRFSVLHHAPRLRVPLLLVHDEDDEAVGAEQAERLAGAFADRARLVVTRRLGHRRILGAPVVVDTVSRFLTGREPGGRGGRARAAAR
ncbi:alpha/beta hydrolase [Streptomyces sp. WAC 04229]|uniref:alpha/beta hydrolase n=1 Tax=Streptomyces sp. WAC 04229 TaxID=2203206 RepID=UPI000F7459A7|nr:alpha/beta hydrolase [Streptomyces sp. WAC 04229]RSN55684.1 alpha/beta hydrolase [Streptomyces sp. WAC 04229]